MLMQNVLSSQVLWFSVYLFLRNPKFAGFRSEPQLFWECGFRGKDCNVSETPGTLRLLLFAKSEQLGVHRRELRSLTFRSQTLKAVIVSHHSVCALCWGKVPLIVPGLCVGWSNAVNMKFHTLWDAVPCALCVTPLSGDTQYFRDTGRTINKWH